MIRPVIYKALNDALGSSVGAIRPLVLLQTDTLPAITYKLEIDTTHVFEGRDNFETVIAEINIYAKSHSEAHQFKNAVESALVDATGAYENLILYKPRLNRVIDDFINDPGEYRINCQFNFSYKTF